MRECLIDGPVKADNLDDFLKLRSDFICREFSVKSDSYERSSKNEIERILAITAGSEVNLWFEDDLFCQTNMWFCCDLLKSIDNLSVFLIRPNHDDWSGFGIMTQLDLQKAFENRAKFEFFVLHKFSNLWAAYQNEDHHGLVKNAIECKKLIPRISEVVMAHIERKRNKAILGRPERTLIEILENDKMQFAEAFKAFSQREGIYGFGDVQVKIMYDNIRGK